MMPNLGYKITEKPIFKSFVSHTPLVLGCAVDMKNTLVDVIKTSWLLGFTNYKGREGIEPWPQRWEARVLPLCHHGPHHAGLETVLTG